MSRHVRAYRRIGTVDGVEVHKAPVGPEVTRDVPIDTELVSRGSLEEYEDVAESDLRVVGLEAQHVFVARAEDGRIQGILVGFFLGDEVSELDPSMFDSMWEQDILMTHAYIDALEVYEKRQGVGRRLFLAFEKWAKERGAEGIAGSPMNEDAKAFDEAMGMAEHPQDYKLWVKPPVSDGEEFDG